MKSNQPWRKYITIDDMPNDDLRTFAETVGIDKAIDTILELPVLAFSIPRKPFRRAREQYIMEQYDGRKYTLNKLALECDFTTKQVYAIINRNKQRQLKKLKEK